MSNRIPPKLAVINSFAGYGRCSITEALPIISAMKVQACPVPTGIFSNHTGFSTHYCQDFTDHIPAYLAQWEQLGVVFDGIYCGFLGHREQIPAIADFFQKQRAKGCGMILLDPVMGDHGKTYRTINEAHADALKSLVRLADIITPNLTEACLLTDTPYREDFSQKELEALCLALHRLGPQKVAITGIGCVCRTSDLQTVPGFLNLISTGHGRAATCTLEVLTTPSAGPSRHGTGDIFASILAADAVNQVPLSVSVKKAADFISTCISASQALQIPETEGVCFENFLGMLMG